MGVYTKKNLSVGRKLFIQTFFKTLIDEMGFDETITHIKNK